MSAISPGTPLQYQSLTLNNGQSRSVTPQFFRGDSVSPIERMFEEDRAVAGIVDTEAGELTFYGWLFVTVMTWPMRR